MARDYGIKAADSDDIRQHKMMAMGKDILPGGDFGCAPLSSTTGSGAHEQGGPVASRTIKEGRKRNAPVAHSRGMGQANPDHGKL